MKPLHVNGLLLTACVCFLLAACSGGEKKEAEGERQETPAAGDAVVPAPGRRVIEVEMYSNEKGNYFEPNEIAARQGDVVRFVIKLGVHNVHFLADSNPGKTGLPPASELLQLPDQAYDLLVTFEPGRYYFQCDPHALLGMKGHLTVGK